MLLSTIESIFSGQRTPFKGLAISRSDWLWEENPVLHLDLNVRDYRDESSLNSVLIRHLEAWERKYGISHPKQLAEDRFIDVIQKAHAATGHQVVILIDEYDKPLLRALHDSELQRIYRNQLQAFYGVLKSLDHHIRFAMLTGVTRFGKMNIFSGLNNLKDITLDVRYNSLCGIAESEIEPNLKDAITEFADVMHISYHQLCAMLKSNYDGYHFADGGEDIYNPFSLLSALVMKKMSNFWFMTATPTFLVDLLKTQHYILQNLEGETRNEDDLLGAETYRHDLVPMFFQTGYLTIKEYNPLFRTYTLGYPNKEVEESFLKFLIPYYSPAVPSGSKVSDLVSAVMNGNTDRFMNILQAFFADFPYHQIPDMEVHYQNVVYIILKLMGLYVRTEYQTSNGRIDLVIDTARYVYVIEFKLGGSPATALKQIEERGYCRPFEGSSKQIIKLGVVFDRRTRSMGKWLQA